MIYRPTQKFLRKICAFISGHVKVFSYTVYCEEHGVILFEKIAGHRMRGAHGNPGMYEEVSCRNEHCCNGKGSRTILAV